MCSETVFQEAFIQINKFYGKLGQMEELGRGVNNGWEYNGCKPPILKLRRAVIRQSMSGKQKLKCDWYRKPRQFELVAVNFEKA